MQSRYTILFFKEVLQVRYLIFERELGRSFCWDNDQMLLAHIDAQIVNQNIELHVNPNGVGTAEQSIVIEDLATQYDYSAMSSDQIITTLLQQQVLMHET